ncbi:MAG: HU family DNA-binding protein [Bacillota bacterium]|nr:HU family DNA-binding protein [Bacillota bacterium]
MKKSELVHAISSKSGLSKVDSEKALNAMLSAVSMEVAKGGKVQLIGFGSFESRNRSARMTRNPKTGAKIRIGPTRVPAFRAGKVFKDMLKLK